MTHGKKVCKIQKEIRRQIADKNEIAYVTSECHFQGECKGTCPKCEAEVKYLEDELQKRKQLGKAVIIAGISLGMIGSFTACNAPKPENPPASGQETAMEIIKQDTTVNASVSVDTFPVDTERICIISTIPPDIIEGEIPVPGGIGNEIPPEYPDGEEALINFLRENLVYPEEAREKGIEGRVIVRFFVEENGNLSDIEAVKGIGGGCDEEAVRVIKMMPKWKAGTVEGKATRFPMTIPMVFKLE